MLAEVRVYPRREILDPQGKAIAAALERLDFDGVADVRAGKVFRIQLDGVDAEEARAQLETLADRLLANSVVEDFTVEILDDEGGS
ncbi:MAG: phosphoribosylformylglycinamidine synthase subunit PurS [Acidobacteriota bacterium]